MAEVTVNDRPIDYSTVPVHYMADGMKLYIEHGIMPGSFMTAALCNDLMDACGRADESNKRALFDWASWLYNHAPSGSFGSRDRVEEWVKSRRSLATAAPEAE